jgi:hypothetical protein
MGDDNLGGPSQLTRDLWGELKGCLTHWPTYEHVEWLQCREGDLCASCHGGALGMLRTVGTQDVPDKHCWLLRRVRAGTLLRL